RQDYPLSQAEGIRHRRSHAAGIRSKLAAVSYQLFLPVRDPKIRRHSVSRTTPKNQSQPKLQLKAKSCEEFEMSILFVTGIEGARNCADVVGKLLDMEVVIAEGRKGALALLRQREFAAVVVDDTVAACDPAAAEVIWERSGLAIPIQVSFAV